MKKRNGSEDIALVSSVMSMKLIKINADSNALQVAKKMSDNKVSSVILTDDQDKIEGIVTERDLVRNICANDALPSQTPIISILTRLLSIITIDKDSTVEEAAHMMQNQLERQVIMHLLSHIMKSQADTTRKKGQGK